MSQVLAANDIVELKLYCRSGTQFSINTRHYLVADTDGTSVSDVAALTALDALWAPVIRAALSENATYNGASLQIIRPTRRPKTGTSASTGVGTFEGDVLPHHVAGLVSFLSDLAIRSGRGRMYVPFPSEQANDTDGQPTVTYVGALGSIGALSDDIQVVGTAPNQAALTPVLYNRDSHGYTVLTHYQSRLQWASCRRRQDSRGADRDPF